MTHIVRTSHWVHRDTKMVKPKTCKTTIQKPCNHQCQAWVFSMMWCLEAEPQLLLLQLLLLLLLQLEQLKQLLLLMLMLMMMTTKKKFEEEGCKQEYELSSHIDTPHTPDGQTLQKINNNQTQPQNTYQRTWMTTRTTM
jgi:hypothetical protein